MEMFYPDKGQLPENNTYVLCHHTRGTWRDSTDQAGCEWVVLKFIKGLSAEDRNKLPENDDRKKRWSKEDEGFNNLKPYCWQEFGPDCFFGQDIDKWCHLPDR